VESLKGDVDWSMVAYVAVIVVTAILIVFSIGEVVRHGRAAWRRRHEPRRPPPYDYTKDDGLLDVWAREEQGEVLAVGHLSDDGLIRWKYK
jgi:hypothetical protein